MKPCQRKAPTELTAGSSKAPDLQQSSAVLTAPLLPFSQNNFPPFPYQSPSRAAGEGHPVQSGLCSRIPGGLFSPWLEGNEPQNARRLRRRTFRLERPGYRAGPRVAIDHQLLRAQGSASRLRPHLLRIPVEITHSLYPLLSLKAAFKRSLYGSKSMKSKSTNFDPRC